MNRFNHIFLISLTISFCSIFRDVFAQEWGPLTNGVQVSISLATNQPIKVNQPIVILFKIRNILTNETVGFFSGGSPETSFSYKIATPSEKKPPRNMDVILTGSLGAYRVLPKEVQKYSVNLSLLYDFNEVGTYRIVGKAEAESQTSMLSHEETTFDENKSFKVISNPINITIVSDK